MLSYIVRRILIAIPVLLGITFITFALVSFAPGDPISSMLMGSEQLNPDLADSLREFYGLDQPWYVQYATYLGNLVRGNLGISISSRASIGESIASFLPNTMLLAFSSMLLALLVSIPHRNRQRNEAQLPARLWIADCCNVRCLDAQFLARADAHAPVRPALAHPSGLWDG